MKKALLMLVLLLLAAAGVAQAGLLGLEPEASGSGSIASLIARGFTETSREGKTVYLENAAEPGLASLKLYLGEAYDNLVSWEFSYDTSKVPALMDSLLAGLKALHGEPDVVDDYDRDFIWYFPNDRALYVDLYEGAGLTIYYTPGNWDDDDYYYYEDEWY